MKGLFTKSDLLLLKWKILTALICLGLALALYLGMQYLSSETSNALRRAEVDLRNARSQVQLIEEEESTIIAYIDRYQELRADGAVLPEDRLQFLEKFAEIREAYDLFPIALSIPEQSTIQLQYPLNESDPGGPVELNSTLVEISLPLLHEEDLGRLLRTLLNSPGLYQIKDCIVSLRNPNATNFLVLGQHQQASCNILWYTFDVDSQLNQDNF